MELTGGEYWTFFLKRRVGKSAAKELTGATRPITASQAHAIGMVNDLLHYSPSSSFSEEVSDQLLGQPRTSWHTEGFYIPTHLGTTDYRASSRPLTVTLANGIVRMEFFTAIGLAYASTWSHDVLYLIGFIFSTHRLSGPARAPLLPPPSLPLDQTQTLRSLFFLPSTHRIFELQYSLDKLMNFLPQLSNFVRPENGSLVSAHRRTNITLSTLIATL